jgi:glucan phosphoethanolaminetransferase (alkaline phosphatase superfamily)
MKKQKKLILIYLVIFAILSFLWYIVTQTGRDWLKRYGVQISPDIFLLFMYFVMLLMSALVMMRINKLLHELDSRQKEKIDHENNVTHNVLNENEDIKEVRNEL